MIKENQKHKEKYQRYLSRTTLEERRKKYKERYQKNKERILERGRMYYWSDMEKSRAKSKEQYEKSKGNPRVKFAQKKWGDKQTKCLTDFYIKKIFFKGAKGFDLPKELIEAKRLQILIERELQK